ncbi:ABC transporter ATP-binding protein [Roseivivax isoporae]|uniref:ABC transporter ATP-binding protein n=1 Tax=Roseivivax isoporae TaxID=591206 RepID=UPI0004B060E9|nr:ABC transporter ATP-binding protein [Roseivivax isoporae]
MTEQAGSKGHVPLIEFRGVGKRFTVKGEPLQAVRDIDLKVREGEILTLVGPSGCGKSTLLNMAAGLFEATEGEVIYRGAPVKPYNNSVGYMTQSDHLLPWRDVIGNIAIPLEIKGLPKAQVVARVEELMETVGLTGFGRSYPNQLSGGMRKRCALARLLAYDPETLLMDEPFAALDAMLRMRMQIEIRALCRRLGKTVMFVTHDLDEAVAIGDRCVVFTGRPGTIERVVDVPLPPDRDILQLRKDRDYQEITATLWDVLAPAVGMGD